LYHRKEAIGVYHNVDPREAQASPRSARTRLDQIASVAKRDIPVAEERTSAIRSLIGAYGYTAERLQHGRAFYTAAVDTVNAQAAAAGAQRLATQRCDAAEKQARKNYKALTKIARAVFSANSPERAALDLRGPMPESLSGFLGAARTLYDNALSVAHVKEAIAEYGYDAARLAAEQAALAACEQARQAQIAAMSAAIEATQTQTAALKALQGWMVRYRAVVTTALENDPQLLERLGFAVRTTPLPRTTSDTSTPAAPSKAAA